LLTVIIFIFTFVIFVYFLIVTVIIITVKATCFSERSIELATAVRRDTVFGPSATAGGSGTLNKSPIGGRLP
jgi:hypothetical protein